MSHGEAGAGIPAAFLGLCTGLAPCLPPPITPHWYVSLEGKTERTSQRETETEKQKETERQNKQTNRRGEMKNRETGMERDQDKEKE